MHAPQALTVKTIRLTRVALILDLAAGWKIFRKLWRHPCSRVTHDENAFQRQRRTSPGVHEGKGNSLSGSNIVRWQRSRVAETQAEARTKTRTCTFQ